MKQLFHTGMNTSSAATRLSYPSADPFICRTEPTQPKPDGELAGLSLAVKDLFHICGIPTSAGNPAWLKSHPTPQQTSPVVTRLEEAGAQLVGKTLTDELAYSLNGQNSHFGTPLNHAAPDRLPGGSSSGSATAVASGQADIGLGTDTGGSIRVPASYNGLFGIRPTHGTISTDKMVPLAPSFDTVGWMTRDLSTLRKVGRVLLSDDKNQDQAKEMCLLQSSELFVQTAHGEQVQQWLSERTPKLTDLQDALNPVLLTSASDAFRILQGAEIWQTHGEWVEQHWADIGQDIRERLAWCKQISSREIAQANDQRARFNDLIASLLKGTNALVLPTTPGPAPLLAADATYLSRYRNHLLGFTAIAGLAGLPQLHLPILLHENAPVGVSLIGPKHSDLALMALAKQLMEKHP